MVQKISASSFSGHSVAKSKGNKIIIPKEILDKLENELLKKKGNNMIKFEPWEDEVIRRYGKTHSLKGISRILNKASTTVRRRYRIIMGLPLDKI